MYKRHVVVVENEALLRDLIAQTLEGAGFQVTTAANVSDAKRAVGAVDPDAVVVDIELGPGPNGFDFAEFLTRTAPEIGIVFLTNVPDPRFVGRERKDVPQNSAYLRKSQLVNTTELIDALEAVLKDRVSVKFRHDLDSTRPFAKLSKKQLGVLALVARGMSNTQIAEIRGTTVRAVEGMVSRVFEALEINPAADGNARVEAARMFLRATGNISGQ
ncbi:MAG: response regulator transcription factor [Micrococcales bacterium]